MGWRRRFVDLRSLLDELRVERTEGGFVGAWWRGCRCRREPQMRSQKSLRWVEFGKGLARRLPERVVIQYPMYYWRDRRMCKSWVWKASAIFKRLPQMWKYRTNLITWKIPWLYSSTPRWWRILLSKSSKRVAANKACKRSQQWRECSPVVADCEAWMFGAGAVRLVDRAERAAALASVGSVHVASTCVERTN